MSHTPKNLVLATVLMLTAVVGATSSTSAAPPGPTADYRFNDNLKSSVHKESIPSLIKVGNGFVYATKNVKGKTDTVLAWPKGSGLKLKTAKKAVGSKADYTIAMLVRLIEVEAYGKLVDFEDRTSESGFYVVERFLHPYGVYASPTRPEEPPFVAGRWHQVVMTRVGLNVKGYVDGERYFIADDSTIEFDLGFDEILHFLIDDEAGADEETGGEIARLRIWKDPLTDHQAKNLKL